MTMTPLGAAVEPEVYCRKARLSPLIPGSRQASAAPGAISSISSVARQRSLPSSGTSARAASSRRRRIDVVRATAGRESRTRENNRGKLCADSGG